MPRVEIDFENGTIESHTDYEESRVVEGCVYMTFVNDEGQRWARYWPLHRIKEMRVWE